MSFHFRSYSESTSANGRLLRLNPSDQQASTNNNNNDGVSSTTGETSYNQLKIEPNNNNNNSCSPNQQLPVSIHDGSSNGIIRIHSDSQQSLDRLFNLSGQSEASVPLRQRNLPSSFFNPTPVSKGAARVSHQSLHCRSTSFNFAGQLAGQHQHQADPSQAGARLSQGFHSRTHSAQVTSASIGNIVGPPNASMVPIGSQSSGLAGSCSSQSLQQISPHVSHNNLASSSSQLNQPIANQCDQAAAPMQAQQQQQQQHHFRAAQTHNQPNQATHHYRNYSSPSFTLHHQPANIVINQVHSNHNPQSSNHNNRQDNQEQQQQQQQQQNGFNQQTKLDPYRQVVGSQPEFMDTSTFANDVELPHQHAVQQASSVAAINGAQACQMHQQQQQFAAANNGHIAAPMHHYQPNPHAQAQTVQQQQQHGHIVTEQPKFHIVHSYQQQSQPQQTFSGSYELATNTRQQPMQHQHQQHQHPTTGFGFAPNPSQNGYAHANHHWNESNGHHTSQINHCHSHQSVQAFGSNMAAVGNDWTTPNAFVNVAQKF